MQFLMFVTSDPEPDATGEGTIDVEEWVERFDSTGRRLLGDRVQGDAAAVSVRRREGRVSVTQGPYAESTEWLLGFDVLECDSLNEAVEIAGLHPMAAGGRIELRPFWDWDAE